MLNVWDCQARCLQIGGYQDNMIIMTVQPLLFPFLVCLTFSRLPSKPICSHLHITVSQSHRRQLNPEVRAKPQAWMNIMNTSNKTCVRKLCLFYNQTQNCLPSSSCVGEAGDKSFLFMPLSSCCGVLTMKDFSWNRQKT